MAEIKVKVFADLAKLKDQIKGVLKEKFKINVGGGSEGGGSTGSKKGIGLLGGILKSLGPLAILMKILSTLRVFELLGNFAVLLFLEIAKGIGKLPNLLLTGWAILKEKLIELKNRLVEKVLELKNKLVAKLISLKDKFIMLKDKFLAKMNEWKTKLIELKNRFLAKMNEWKEKLLNLKNGFLEKMREWKAKLIELKDRLVAKFAEWKAKLIELKDKLVGKFEEWKAKLIELKDRFLAKMDEWKTKLEEWKTKLTELKDKLIKNIQDLPSNIWGYIKGLGRIIADAIRGLISWGRKSDKREPDKKKPEEPVGDAIIKPNGQIIRTNPNDTIIATQTPGNIGGNTTLNFYGVTPQEMITAMERHLGKGVIRASRF